MIFNKNDKYKHFSMFFFYNLQKGDIVEDDDTILFFDFSDGEYSISVKDLREKASEELNATRIIKDIDDNGPSI